MQTYLAMVVKVARLKPDDTVRAANTRDALANIFFLKNGTVRNSLALQVAHCAHCAVNACSPVRAAGDLKRMLCAFLNQSTKLQNKIIDGRDAYGR